MQKKENAILLGIGATTRKFYTTNSDPGELYAKIPIIRYIANAPGKLCRGKGNYKRLFLKGDIVEVLCPETVMEDRLSTLFIHRLSSGKEMLMQRHLSDYTNQLEFKEECTLRYKVIQTGHFTCGSYEECVCIQPIPGSNLWVDKRLVVEFEGTETKKPEEENAHAPELPAQNSLFNNNLDDSWGYDECNPFYPDDNNNDFL